MGIIVTPFVSNESNFYQFLIFSDTAVSPTVRYFVLHSFCHTYLLTSGESWTNTGLKVKLVSYDFAKYRHLTNKRASQVLAYFAWCTSASAHTQTDNFSQYTSEIRTLIKQKVSRQGLQMYLFLFSEGRSGAGYG